MRWLVKDVVSFAEWRLTRRKSSAAEILGDGIGLRTIWMTLECRLSTVRVWIAVQRSVGSVGGVQYGTKGGRGSVSARARTLE